MSTCPVCRRSLPRAAFFGRPDAKGPGSWCQACYHARAPKLRRDCLPGGFNAAARRMPDPRIAELRRYLPQVPLENPCEWSRCRYYLPFGQCALSLATRAPHLPLEDIGALFGLTRERVRQVQIKAEAKLRRGLGLSEDGELLLPELAVPLAPA